MFTPSSRQSRAPRFIRPAWLVAIAACCALVAHDARAETVQLRLMAFNDFHGHLEPGGNALNLQVPGDASRKVSVPAGGAAWLAGLIGQLRREVPNTVVFSSGDMIGASPLVSTLFRHESTVAVMNAIGLDFGITGNHEFDAGQDELRRMVKGGCAANGGNTATTSCALGAYGGMKFPLLAANVEGEDGKPIFQPTLVKEFGGIKVGFIGVVVKTTPVMVMPSGVKGLSFRDEVTTLNRYARELRNQGVKAIVAVVHEGGEVATDWNDTACTGNKGRIFKIAGRLSGDIDVVFSAHTHEGYNCIIDTPKQKGLRVIQATSFGRGLAVIDVELDMDTRDIVRERTQSRNIAVVNTARDGFAAVPSDPAIAKLVGDYVTRAAPIAERPVGKINEAVKRGPAEGNGDAGDNPAGRLVADAQLAATQAKNAGAAQIALTNVGGIRSALPCAGTPPCTVTYGQVFTMQPFGNTLTVMTLTGRQLKALLEDQQKPKKDEPDFLQPSRGLTYTWKRSAPFNKRVTDLRIDGEPVRSGGRYRVTVSSYLAEGGGGFKRLKEGGDRVGGPLDSDALVDYLQANQVVNVDTQPRIKLAD